MNNFLRAILLTLAISSMASAQSLRWTHTNHFPTNDYPHMALDWAGDGAGGMVYCWLETWSSFRCVWINARGQTVFDRSFVISGEHGGGPRLLSVTPLAVRLQVVGYGEGPGFTDNRLCTLTRTARGVVTRTRALPLATNPRLAPDRMEGRWGFITVDRFDNGIEFQRYSWR